MKRKARSTVRPLPAGPTDEEIVDFLERHDPVELERAGIMVPDRDRSDLETLLGRHLTEPNDADQHPPSAKALLRRIASRKTLDASTLARLWIVERLRREIRN